MQPRQPQACITPVLTKAQSYAVPPVPAQCEHRSQYTYREGKAALPGLPVPAASYPHHQPDADMNSACEREEAPLAKPKEERMRHPLLCPAILNTLCSSSKEFGILPITAALPGKKLVPQPPSFSLLPFFTALPSLPSL